MDITKSIMQQIERYVNLSMLALPRYRDGQWVALESTQDAALKCRDEIKATVSRLEKVAKSFAKVVAPDDVKVVSHATETDTETDMPNRDSYLDGIMKHE